MATPRVPARPAPVLLSLLLAAVIGVGLLPAGTGRAEPRPTIAEVSARVDALDAQADQAVEAYDQAQLDLAAAKRRTDAVLARVQREQAHLTVVQGSINDMVAAAYRNGGDNNMVSLMTTSDPQSFLDRASSLDLVARSQAQQLQAVRVARHSLAEAQARANEDLAAQRDVEQRLGREKAAIDSALNQQKQLLGSLRAEEARQLAAARAAREAAAAKAAAAAAAAESARAAQAARASRSRSAAAPSYTGPASGRAAIAVREAYRQLGKPYQWGAGGPGSFDCSGLTAWVWAKAGVSLPHSSGAQYGSGPHVSRGDLQPGDLVFFGHPIHHVGIYVGGGSMISAPHTGDVVRVQSAFRGDYVGAVRP